MRNPTNKDLHVLLARIEERQIAVIEKVDDIKTALRTHQEKDDNQFKELGDSVNSLHKYAASIAIISSAIGGGFTWVWGKITGQT